LEENYQPISDILKIILPTLIGAIATRYIVNSWQIKKEKFKLQKEKYGLRQEFLENFHFSLGATESLYNTLFDKIRVHYISKWIHMPDSKLFTYQISLKDGEANLPRNVFSEDIKLFNKKLSELDFESNKFFMLKNTYFQSKDVDKAYNELLKADFYVRNILNALILSNNYQELRSNILIFEENSVILSSNGGKLIVAFSKTPFRISPEEELEIKSSKWNNFKKRWNRR